MSIDYERIDAAPIPPAARSFRVRMRDGVHLATDVYLPEGTDAPGPTILIRLPYDKAGDYAFIPLVAEYMTGRGYRVVAQDVRGKFRSEGQALLFVNEADDGYDTIEWVSRQSWSDGAVAMWGDSYYGYTQWAAAASAHPALKAIAPRVTGTRLGEFPTAEPGSRQRDVEMAIILLYPLTHFHSQETYLWEPDWSERPYVRDLEEFQREVGTRSASFDLWYPHPVILPRFRDGSPFDAPAVPVLNTIGWWDNCAPWSWHDHETIARRPAWRQNEFLLLESIDHENYPFGYRGGERTLEETREMLPAYLDPALEFFDVFVRGAGAPESIPRVRWNLAGTEGYRHSALWPPAGAAPRTLWAHGDGALATEAAEPSEARWRHDPDDLVPSSAPDPFSFLLSSPDERALAERPDVVGFVGDATATDTDLAGPVSVTATVVSTGPRTDLFARLYDVAPDGTLFRIARGQTTIERAEEPLTVALDLGHVGYRLRAGHRLRLHLQSSDFPEFVPQPGTHESGWTAVEVRPTEQTVLLGGPDGLRVDLLVLDEPGPAHPLIAERTTTTKETGHGA
jgi:putative CocE/NonD family hydrolase